MNMDFKRKLPILLPQTTRLKTTVKRRTRSFQLKRFLTKQLKQRKTKAKCITEEANTEECQRTEGNGKC